MYLTVTYSPANQIAGELSSEQNMIGLVLIGGGLAVINVFITASSLEKARELEEELEDSNSSYEGTALRRKHSSRRRAQDMMSIDLDELSFEDEHEIHANNTPYEEGERYPVLPRHPSRAHSYYRRRYDPEPAEETRRTRRDRIAKRTRRETRYDDEEQAAEVRPQRTKVADTATRKSRKPKARRDKLDRSERVERYRERDKREVKRRGHKHKKKRVTIAPGSQEKIIIGEF